MIEMRVVRPRDVRDARRARVVRVGHELPSRAAVRADEHARILRARDKDVGVQGIERDERGLRVPPKPVKRFGPRVVLYRNTPFPVIITSRAERPNHVVPPFSDITMRGPAGRAQM